MKLTRLTILLAVTFMATTATGGAAQATDNIVLVHGLNMDGSTWQAVNERLSAKGYKVTIAQLPMTSVADDVAAVSRLIESQEGPVVLVGNSYGGMIISQAGVHPAVDALVYIAAFQPEIGESLAFLNTSTPAEIPADASRVFADGYYVVDPKAWLEYVANGLSPSDAEFTAMFQTPANTTIFGYEAEVAAWRDIPSWSVIAVQDRTIAPQLQREMARRAQSNVVEIDGGHLLQMSHPDDVTAVIEQAARQAD